MLIYLSMIEDERRQARFASIYHQYKNLMLHAAFTILKNQNDAEDIVHEAFVVSINYLDRLPEETTRAFLLAVTESRAINLWRRQHHFGEQIPYEEAVGRSIPQSDGIGLSEAIARLPADYRSILLLRFHMGYTTREIAKMTGKKEGTVTRTITRAKDRLAKELDKIQKELNSI